ncbi:MAG TPA: hypothetical protein VF621_06125 [Pyrinomonadaceae bacterium]
MVGAGPNRTYRSASPVPPEVWNCRFDAPAGTLNVQNCWLPPAPEGPDTGTPFCIMLLADDPEIVTTEGCRSAG